jgi:hypothetical protein
MKIIILKILSSLMRFLFFTKILMYRISGNVEQESIIKEELEDIFNKPSTRNKITNRNCK